MAGVQGSERAACSRHGLSKENASCLTIGRRLGKESLDLIQGQATIDQLNWSAFRHVVSSVGLRRQGRDLGGIPGQTGVVKARSGDVTIRKALFLTSATSCSDDDHLLIAHTLG